MYMHLDATCEYTGDGVEFVDSVGHAILKLPQPESLPSPKLAFNPQTPYSKNSNLAGLFSNHVYFGMVVGRCLNGAQLLRKGALNF